MLNTIEAVDFVNEARECLIRGISMELSKHCDVFIKAA